MNGRLFIFGTLLLLSLHEIADGRKRRRKSHIKDVSRNLVLSDEPLVNMPVLAAIGNCTCKCCGEKKLEEKTLCGNDIIVAVDSSACFRDHHRRMKQFLQKMVKEIHGRDEFQFGVNYTRLAIMQFSSTQVFPVSLDAFENYQNPSESRELKDEISQKIEQLDFLGQGAYLHRALDAAYDHFVEAFPRPFDHINGKRMNRTVIVLTNGKSHPDVSTDDVQASWRRLRDNGIKVLPVSVTRQCYSAQSSEWEEGLCPDVEILKIIGEDAYSNGDDFLPMRSSGTVSTVVTEATKCPSEVNSARVDPCNTCNCSCELPVGPRGRPGPGGVKGDTIQGVKGDLGPKGKDGDEGPQGRQGIAGLKGGKGDVGPQGIKGDVGPEGVDGVRGATGEPGERGPVGEVGPEGTPGNRGEKGSTGDKGEIGEWGETGDQGLKGDTGDNGNIGPIGPPGPKGIPGIEIKGAVGDAGEKGVRGADGEIGEPGAEGPKGSRGLCGKPGPAGPEGELGAPGVDGAAGRIGSTGIQGPRGTQGAPGVKGAKGESGRDGEVGANGSRGPVGSRGVQGRTGLPGQNGLDSQVRGPTGREGPRGPKGLRGLHGPDGFDGLQGSPGQQGLRGQSGVKGQRGAVNLDSLRPALVEMIRELLPGDCATGPGDISDVCQESPIDLVFLIDGSDSIDRDDFKEVQNWILKTVDGFNPGSRRQKLQVDVVQFSEQVRTEVHQVVVVESSEEIRPAVEGIDQMRSGTKTYHGLRYINDIVTPTTRDNSYKILVTMSDGDASEEPDQGAIDVARSNFDLMLAVGIGDKVNEDQLQDFAYKTNPISVDEFASLSGAIEEIVEATCRHIGENEKEESESSSGEEDSDEWSDYIDLEEEEDTELP